MRVAMYYRNDDVRVEQLDRPAVGPGELLVRVEASGVCGSDVMEWYRAKLAPLVLGHEISGQIVEVGAGADANFALGDRVTATHHVPCNTCHVCRRGNETYCQTLRSTKFDPGGFAEFLRIPALQADRGTLRLPDAVSFEEATFVEPLGCVVRAQRIARMAPTQSVLVLGSGIAGLLHIALCRARGAGLIAATDVHPFRLQAACDAGADLVLDASALNTDEIAARLREANDGLLADLVIVCTPAPAVNEAAFRLAERGGTVLFFAVVEPGVALTYPAYDVWNAGLRIVHTYAATLLDLAEALELIHRRRIDVRPLITHRVPLSRAQEAFRLVATAAESVKVIVEPQAP